MTAAVAVTGASGFIGRHLLDALARAGIEALAIGRTGGRAVPGATPVDPLDSRAIAAAARHARAIVHLAGKAHGRDGGATDDGALARANVDHAAAVARAAASLGATLVLVSSAGVLGRRSPPEGFTDASPASPHDAYTRSKLEGERQVRAVAAAAGTPLVIVRPPMVIGPDAPGNFGRLLRLAGRVPLPVRALPARRSIVGARNLADLLIRCATDPRAHGATMLAAEPEPLTVAAMVEAVAAASGRAHATFGLPAGPIRLALRALGRDADLARLFEDFVLHPTEAQARLGWRPPRSTAEELAWSGRAEPHAHRG
jgi:nucleoside-diphosphate-sugar epimerase